MKHKIACALVCALLNTHANDPFETLQALHESKREAYVNDAEILQLAGEDLSKVRVLNYPANETLTSGEYCLQVTRMVNIQCLEVNGLLYVPPTPQVYSHDGQSLGSTPIYICPIDASGRYFTIVALDPKPEISDERNGLLQPSISRSAALPQTEVHQNEALSDNEDGLMRHMDSAISGYETPTIITSPTNDSTYGYSGDERAPSSNTSNDTVAAIVASDQLMDNDC